MHKDIAVTWSVISVGAGLDPSQMNSFYTHMLIMYNCNTASLPVGNFWTLHLLRGKPELIVFIVKLFQQNWEYYELGVEWLTL